MALLTTTLLVSTLAASSLLPQGSSGPMVGTPHTVSVSSGTMGGGMAPISPAEVWFKEAGMVATAPAPVPGGPAIPNFRFSAITGLATPPDMDAESIGLDWVLADSRGIVDIPSNGWGMISFSVSRATSGDAGTLIRGEFSTPGGAAADVFSFILPGSVGAPSVVGVVERGQNEDEVRLGGAAPDIDAHDVFSAGYSLAPEIVAMLPREPFFFFSVPTAALTGLPTSWWAGSTPSGATILMTRWNATTGLWGAVTPFLIYSDLGLASTEDIDALAVDLARRKLMFSTKTVSRNELLIAVPQAGGSFAVFDYMLKSGDPVTKGLGLRLLKVDSIDGVCGLDPGRGGSAQFVQSAVGRPVGQPLVAGLPNEVSASAFRSFNRSGQQDILHTILNGWPRRNPVPSLAILGATFPQFPGSPLLILGNFNRRPPGRFEGGPVHFRIPVPPGMTGRGLEVMLHWLTAEQANPQAIDLAIPVLIRL